MLAASHTPTYSCRKGHDDRSMRKYATHVAEEAGADDLANQYEVLILYGLPVPADLDQKLREAHRRVHLRGLDPLRKTT